MTISLRLNEADSILFKKYAEYHENPITYSLDEVEKELGLG